MNKVFNEKFTEREENMKKHLILALTFLCILCSIILLTGCNSQTKNTQYEINFLVENDLYAKTTVSLSQFFTDQEVVFLCRSIDLYRHISKDNIKYVIDNMIEYIDMFKDTL